MLNYFYEDFNKKNIKLFFIWFSDEKVKTNPSIEYTNCSHLDAVEIELTNLLKQGEEKWNEYWNNQETGLGKNEIKQMKEYIKLHIHNE